MVLTTLFAALTVAKLLPVAVFGAIAAGVWFLLEMFSKPDTRAEQRLDEFRDPALRKRKEEIAMGKGPDTVTRVLEAATPALARPLTSKNEKDQDRLKQRLGEAGFRGETASQVFLGLKFIGLIAGAVLGGGIMLLTGSFNYGATLKCLIFTGGMFYAPEIGLSLLSGMRKEQVFLGLPDALDLMVVCVEAGLGLDQAMRKVSEEMKKSYPVIAEEFGLCNLQLQMGSTRSQVLSELGSRSGVDDLRSLASILIQTDKFGSSVAQALRVQSDAMRTRRRQIAEEKAAKTAVKLIFPLVLFIFPGIFVVLVGPAAITMIREMFPAMQGG